MDQKRIFWIVFLANSFFSLAGVGEEITCRNPQGEAVSWWVVIKVPESFDTYVYRDAKSTMCDKQQSCWGDIRHDLNMSQAGPLSHTLQQVYHGTTEYLFYNDDAPLDAGSVLHSDFAHAKGVLARSDAGGFWLVHSVPRFPREDVALGVYSGLSDNASTNAQSFLCVSLETNQIEAATIQLRVARPFVYQRRGFTGFTEEEVMTGQARLKPLVATGGESVLSFSKSRYWGGDFYDDWVAKELDSSLLVETWNRGRGTLRNVCSARHQIANVTRIQLNDAVAWENRKDHSKWAITSPESALQVVCIGDINRQNGQRVRGGGALCLKNESLWRAFFQMIKSAGRCGGP